MANTAPENTLSLSWHDSAWIPVLSPQNVMNYFSDRSNPFYDRTCNNEVVKMQRLTLEHLNNMTGLEYILLHVQEPILYVIRKQHRHSPNQATPLADYYIIAGVVYQAPDLGSVINSRMLNATDNLQSAFDEAQSFSRYHPSKGYYWEFKDKDVTEKLQGKDKNKKKEEPSSLFQRQRVDNLLTELSKNFPPKYPAPVPPEKPSDEVKVEVKHEVKVEKIDDKSTIAMANQSSIKPPPEKKAKLMR